jgi:uncharacterized membrane protein HdeD (DUF308 family)
MSASPAPPLHSALDRLPLHNWHWFLIRGLVMMGFGIIALFVPGLTLFAFAAVFAIFSFVDGVAGLISGLRGARRHAPRWGVLILSGLSGIAVGVLFAIWPLLSAALYATMIVALIAAWAIVSGALQIVAAIRLRREIKGEWLLGLVGLLTLLLGLWLLARVWLAPLLTVLSVGWLIGLWAIIAGASLMALAMRLRLQGLEPSPEPHPVPSPRTGAEPDQT